MQLIFGHQLNIASKHITTYWLLQKNEKHACYTILDREMVQLRTNCFVLIYLLSMSFKVVEPFEMYHSWRSIKIEKLA